MIFSGHNSHPSQVSPEICSRAAEGRTGLPQDRGGGWTDLQPLSAKQFLTVYRTYMVSSIVIFCQNVRCVRTLTIILNILIVLCLEFLFFFFTYFLVVGWVGGGVCGFWGLCLRRSLQVLRCALGGVGGGDRNSRYFYHSCHIKEIQKK